MFELNIADIIGLVALLFGGGAIGGVLTWKYTRRTAAANAITAEADATKEVQDVYQQLINDVKQDRSEQRQYITELKEDRNAIREERNKMQKRLTQLTDELDDVKRTVARQGRQIEAMRPFLCGDLQCKKRQLVTDWGLVVNSQKTKKDDKTE